MELILKYYRIAFRTKTLPWFWDSKTRCFFLLSSTRKEKKINEIPWWRIRLWLQIIVRAILVLFIITKIVLSQSVEPSEIIYGTFMVSISLITILLYLQHCVHGAAIVRHMNSLFHINRIAGIESRAKYLRYNGQN